MNRKFKFDNYDICTNFTTENVLSITAEDLTTGQYFLNQTVELMRIKKDTVFATLDRKSEKNLKCEINQHIEDGKRMLVISFIVAFDFLPEFRQNVVLELVEKNQKLKNIEASNFRTEVQQIQKLVGDLEKSGVINYHSVNGHSLNQEKEIFSKEVGRSKYILRVSGVYTDSSGGSVGTEKVTFEINPPAGEKATINCSVYSNYGYSYPFSFSHVVQGHDEGILKVVAKKGLQSRNLSTVNFVLMPVATLN